MITETTTAAEILRIATNIAQTDLIFEVTEATARLRKAYDLGFLTGSPEGITTLTAKGEAYLASH